MSADWAWDQADTISEDPDTMGTTFVPVILRSDKMTVSVGTGNNKYYPLYLSIGNIHNNIQCVHQNAVAVIGFLVMCHIPYLRIRNSRSTSLKSGPPSYYSAWCSAFISALTPNSF
ncbi:uncharacterized protein EDB91DRAFT_1245653 [Suillus paluster]|uniref:uncharacterized protein n=1 Tax=Suillus paluster TaxID=48578 RepID=UPI001B85C2AF|nr:uncharacterized protein EDB91DRAFT_1245653 [Suillus paluster]KAG1747216.1 hypothetical protein EDB91DRAFT_1245653 [Suillus paluster]